MPGFIHRLFGRDHNQDCEKLSGGETTLTKAGNMAPSQLHFMLLGKPSRKKKMFSFGHCPKGGGGGRELRLHPYQYQEKQFKVCNICIFEEIDSFY